MLVDTCLCHVDLYFMDQIRETLHSRTILNRFQNSFDSISDQICCIVSRVFLGIYIYESLTSMSCCRVHSVFGKQEVKMKKRSTRIALNTNRPQPIDNSAHLQQYVIAINSTYRQKTSCSLWSCK